MDRLNVRSSPGMSRNTVSIETRMDFISTLPRSPPRPNCMNVIATRPPMVVSEDEAISDSLLQCLHRRVIRLKIPLLLGKTVAQDDGIVDRQSKLQNERYGVCDI